MQKQINWKSIFLTLLALAIVYGVGTTFFTIELERLVERTITPHIQASYKVGIFAYPPKKVNSRLEQPTFAATVD